MHSWLRLPEADRPTLGIITFNAQQQSLILDLLDEAQRAKPELEWFFADERVEPTIVKNLENVQGDERDVILFSITFWKDPSGKPPAMDFGALNRDGGERRLNVAVTRARQELLVFSGFTADQIDTSRTKALAIHHLKAFLDYAERGAIALPAQDIGSVGGLESPFEEAVAAALERRGWMVVPQVGVSGFRIDLGIRHPDHAGAYLAGVECDGATYHSSATARDRDKVREQVLTNLGWTIVRVWSTDWWFDAKGCVERLHSTLDACLRQDRERRAAEEQEPEVPPSHTKEAGDPAIEETFMKLEDELESPMEETREPEFAPDAPGAGEEPVVIVPMSSAIGSSGSADPASCYRITDLSAFRADPEQFYEFAYRGTLKAMVEAVIETESPLRTDILAQRIARAHGWLRTGGRIREKVDLHLRNFDRTTESSGEFIWKKDSVVEILDYRSPDDESARRGIADIPLAELASVVLTNRDVLDEADPAREIARMLGVERLTATSRARLDEAILRAHDHLSDEATS